MTSISRLFALVVASSIISLAFSAESSEAIGRSGGDFWTYEVEFVVAGIGVAGELTYSYVGREVAAVNESRYDCNVMRISGGFSGSSVHMYVETRLNGTFDGYRYESVDGVGVIGEEMILLVDSSVGYDDYQTASYMEYVESTMYGAPLLDGFDPENPDAKSNWTELVDVYSSTSYSDEYSSFENKSAALSEFNISVDSVDVIVDSEAGSFEARRLTVAEDLTYDVMWFSKEVGGFVRIESYEDGEDDPHFVAELSSFRFDLDGSGAVLIAAALSVGLSFAVLVAVLVLAWRRSGGRTMEQHPESTDAELRATSEATKMKEDEPDH